MAELEKRRMKYFSQDFQRLHHTRARTVEELIAVDDENLIALNGAEPIPGGIRRHQMQIALRVFDPEAARRDDDDLWIGAYEVVPGDPRRWPCTPGRRRC